MLLGELPSHGEARAFEAKAAIARRLIERCGFNALLFEAPNYDFLGFDGMAGQPPKPLPDAPAGSLEMIATPEGRAEVFLDAAALRRIGRVPSRLFGRFTEAVWSLHFDGVVVFREERAPTFEPRR